MIKILTATTAILLFIISFSWAQRPDKAGSKDYPLVSRFEGFHIADYEETQFDRYLLPLGPSKNDKEFGKTLSLEGKVTKINYRYQEDPKPSLLQVYKSYENLFTQQDVEVLYSCLDGDCKTGGYDFIVTASVREMMLSNYMRFGKHGYQAVKFSKDGKNIYAALYIRSDNNMVYELHFIEVEAMSNDKVTMADIEKGIEETGKKAFYGLYFDTGKAILKTTSSEELSLMASFLKKNTNRNFYVVGHTDNVGSYDSNMNLSLNRAKSIITALKEQYGVSTVNLQAVGVGSVSPVGSNSTDNGKAMNRRVELVLK